MALTDEQMEKISKAAQQFAQKLISRQVDSDGDGILTESELSAFFTALMYAGAGIDQSSIIPPSYKELSTKVNTNVNSSLSGIRQGSMILQVAKQFENIQAMFDELHTIYSQVGHAHTAEAIQSGTINPDRIGNIDASKITTGVLSRPTKTTVSEPVVISKNTSVDLHAVDHDTLDYFGIKSTSGRVGLSFIDKNDELISNIYNQLRPDGSIQQRLAVHNPQPNSSITLNTQIVQTIGKTGNSNFYWQSSKTESDTSLNTVFHLGHNINQGNYTDVLEFRKFKITHKSADDSYSYNIPNSDDLISALNIKPGNIGICVGTDDMTTGKAYATTSSTINYGLPSGYTFTATPVVVASIESDISGNENTSLAFANMSVHVISVSKTGFKLRVLNYNHKSNDDNAEQSFKINWIAVGTYKKS